MSGPHVCLIGAGCSGITTAKRLRDHGITYDQFEASDDVGGNWYFRNPNGRSAVYESLHIDTSKTRLQFEDFPVPAEWPDFPSHRLMHDYFRAYVDRFDLRDAIEFGTSVDRAAQYTLLRVVATPVPSASASARGARRGERSRDVARFRAAPAPRRSSAAGSARCRGRRRCRGTGRSRSAHRRTRRDRAHPAGLPASVWAATCSGQALNCLGICRPHFLRSETTIAQWYAGFPPS